MNVNKFIDDKVRAIQQAVGDGLAVNALSGGVDSCVVTALGHRALGNRLKTYMIDNGSCGRMNGQVLPPLKNGDQG
jgi:GMP synthase (glutamine-hydrolysing)